MLTVDQHCNTDFQRLLCVGVTPWVSTTTQHPPAAQRRKTPARSENVRTGEAVPPPASFPGGTRQAVALEVSSRTLRLTNPDSFRGAILKGETVSLDRNTLRQISNF